jgi:hypothetical protein
MIRSELDQVNMWIELRAKGLASDQLVQLFNQAVTILWQTANSTMSNFVLKSIMERVLQQSSEGFPLLELLKTEEKGINFGEMQHPKALYLRRIMRLFWILSIKV